MGLIVKFCLAVLAATLCSLPSFATEATEATEANEQTAALSLSALSAALKPQGAVRGEFEQTRTLKALKRPLISTGNFVFSPEQGLIWAQKAPFENVLILSEKRMLSRDSEGLWQQSEIAPKAGPATLMPMLVKAMISGDVATLEQHFAPTLHMIGNHGQGQRGQVNQWQLRLTPKDEDIKALFATIELQGSLGAEASPSAKASTDRLTLISPNGDISDIRFSKLQSGELSAQELQAFSPNIELRH